MATLYILLVVTELSASVAMEALHSFRGCAVREFTFVAQKPGCRTLRVHTEACWGRCRTWERPVPEPPSIQWHHRVCTYSRMRHMTVRLPGCHADVSPLFHYPQAVLCHCSVCSPSHTECVTF